MSKPILISGVQPTGKLHIGNYFGALKNFVDLQNTGRYQCYFFVADLHSLNMEFDPSQKYKEIIDVILNFLSAGLKPDKSTLFVQSQICEHSELAWILTNITPFGELRRMTQFKDKAERQKENVNVGLFNYPVLQAADILLYDAEVVPVGEDQLQHLEFTREIARKFNEKYLRGKKFLIEPKSLLTEIPRLMSLNNPAKKMSKSMPEGCLFLDDSPEEITNKIKKAVTDSGSEIKYDPQNKPAISNLLMIYKGFSDMSIKDIEKKYEGAGYGQFKKDLAKVVIEGLRPFRARKKLLSRNFKKVEKIIESGNKKAKKRASLKMKQIKKIVGLSK